MVRAIGRPHNLTTHKPLTGNASMAGQRRNLFANLKPHPNWVPFHTHTTDVQLVDTASTA